MPRSYKCFVRHLPKQIRISFGSAVVLGLTKARLDAEPTTVYLLTFHPGKCSANCGFCPQARKSRGRADMLSRVTWPIFPTERVIAGIKHAVKKGAIKRICIQALNYPKVFEDILNIAEEILSRVSVPISVSCQPIDREKMKQLSEAGVERMCVPLDAATEELFDRVKGRLADGPYVWKTQRAALSDAVHVFGRDFASTHLIVGLGEKEKEILTVIQWCVDLGVYPGLFAFTPIQGTALENHPRPSIRHYRKIQLAHYLITSGETRYEEMLFDREGTIKDFCIPREQLWHVIRTGKPFLTSGCPGCNRPYYNERPSGPVYNYPQQPQPEEIAKIKKQIFSPNE
jgi:biotin synthase-related radical SAM superfamily protein